LDSLAASPLLAAPHTPSPGALRAWLVAAIDDLAGSPVPVDAEAGLVLRRYYLRKSSTHQGVAQQLHLSRATYFRRLRHGLELLQIRVSAGARGFAQSRRTPARGLVPPSKVCGSAS